MRLAIERYIEETGKDQPDTTMSYHEWHQEYVEWLENKVAMQLPLQKMPLSVRYIPFLEYRRYREWMDSEEGIVFEENVSLMSLDYLHNRKMCYCRVDRDTEGDIINEEFPWLKKIESTNSDHIEYHIRENSMLPPIKDTRHHMKRSPPKLL